MASSARCRLIAGLTVSAVSVAILIAVILVVTW